MNENSWLILVGILAIIIEIILGAVTGFDLLLIGLIFIISGLAGNIFQSFHIALISIAVLSCLYVIFGRRFVHSKLTVSTRATNVDSIMGKHARVTKQITPLHPGQVKVDGEIWRAQSTKQIDVGQEVLIESVSGVTLQVIPTKSG